MAFTFTAKPETNFTKNKSIKIADIFTKQASSRKTLQTIQCTADGQKQTNGKPSVLSRPQKNKTEKPDVLKIKKTSEPVKIYEDVKTPVRFDCKEVQACPDHETTGTQTEKDQNVSNDGSAHNLMVDEDVPAEYWSDVAESRREALSEALDENLQLHKEILNLKEENEKLHELSGQAEYFADIIKDILGKELEDDDEKDEDADKNEESDNNEEKLDEESTSKTSSDDKDTDQPNDSGE